MGILLTLLAAAIVCAVIRGVGHTHTVTITYGGLTSVTGSNSYTGGTSVEMSEAFGASSDQLFALTIDVSQMKTLFLYSDVACTLETNSSSAAAATVTLVAGQPHFWSSTDGSTNPFASTDVTALYVTAAAAGTLTMKYLVDPTV